MRSHCCAINPNCQTSLKHQPLANDDALLLQALANQIERSIEKGHAAMLLRSLPVVNVMSGATRGGIGRRIVAYFLCWSRRFLTVASFNGIVTGTLGRAGATATLSTTFSLLRLLSDDGICPFNGAGVDGVVTAVDVLVNMTEPMIVPFTGACGGCVFEPQPL